MSVRWKQAAIASCLLGLAQACKCVPVDYPVSSPPGVADHRHFSQSETSMVRVDLPPNRPQGEPASRLVVAYNDGTDAMMDVSPGCWRYPTPASLDGWATSDMSGGPWVRHDQLPVSAALREKGVNARHGDPWLAVNSSKIAGQPGVVLYVSVGQQGLDRIGPPWFVLLSRSRDDGKTFEDAVPTFGPDAGVPDGPKVAITGDGEAALVAWAGYSYQRVWDLHAATMRFSPPRPFDPMANASPPHPSCTSGAGVGHPHVAAGLHHFYLAGEVRYAGCNGGAQTRLEVHRISVAALATGGQWERILSATPPANEPGVGRGVLNAQDALAIPRFGTRTDRGDILPSLAIGEDEAGEFAIVVTEQVQAGTAANELHRERLIQFRIPTSATCDAARNRRDLGTCGIRIDPQELESISTPSSEMRSVKSRVGLWASKPAAFTGKVPDGTIDKRVGILWYAQPYKGRADVNDELRTRTIIEAAMSSDGGKTYSGPFNLTVATEGDGIYEDPDIGSFFWPCQILCSGYYGEYVSGAFQQSDARFTAGIVAAWGDSREGCTNQTHSQLQHQHVWAGALRARKAD